jgi:hypothetical protein
MLLLATQAEPQMRQWAHLHLGRLVTPRHFPRIATTAARDIPWAADCDGFGGFDAGRYERMLGALRGVPGCLFVVAPDVPGEAGLTDLLFEEWMPRIAAHGLPVAYVVQEEGCEYEPRGVPWGAIDALFIGCVDDREKLGPRIRALVADARRRGRWVHMGRVNSARRVAIAREIGCDSIDGSGWVRWRDAHLRRGLALVSAPPQMSLLAPPAGRPRSKTRKKKRPRRGRRWSAPRPGTDPPADLPPDGRTAPPCGRSAVARPTGAGPPKEK